MKKGIAWLLVMGMCAGLLAGCGGQSDTAQEAAAEPGAEVSESAEEASGENSGGVYDSAYSAAGRYSLF